MSDLRVYKDVKSFLKDCLPFLEGKEMENNVLLGSCYNLILENKHHPDHVFLNVLGSQGLMASSVKLSKKVVVYGNEPDALQLIFDYYANHKIDFSGVIGESKAIEHSEKFISSTVLQRRKTLVQGLSKLNDLHLVKGSFEPARLSDLETLKKWTVQFFEDEHLFPKRSEEETRDFLKSLMHQGNLFSWIYADKVVSMAAIIRKTRTTAIIGLVYTPPQFRKQGFGSSCVHQLSEFILKRGFKQSGLLVYNQNNVAQKIYAQLGYQTVSELTDLDFN